MPPKNERQTQPSREVVVQEAELSLLINQLQIAISSIQTAGTLVNGMIGRLQQK